MVPIHLPVAVAAEDPRPVAQLLVIMLPALPLVQLLTEGARVVMAQRKIILMGLTVLLLAEEVEEQKGRGQVPI
ncbi:MAG: hypothetical protein IH628_10360 [Proteobacteria bacterium]|nr:hypothetical protein [Pseudomonadota bacterium]